MEDFAVDEDDEGQTSEVMVLDEDDDTPSASKNDATK